MAKPDNLPKRLTNTTIPGLPIPSQDEGRYDIRDHQPTNLYLTVYPSDRKSWVYRYRAAGKSKRYLIGNGDLELEMDAIPDLRAAIAYCKAHKDYVSREIFDSILQSEEEHVDWLETPLELIEKMGLENFILRQT